MGRQPTIVLAPGFDGTGKLFAPLLAALGAADAPGDTVVVRYPDTLPATLDAHVEHLEASLDRSQPFVLVGESFSGPVTLECLRRDASGCCGLLLMATFVRNPRPWLLTRWSAMLVRPLLGIRPPAWALRRYLTGPDPDGHVMEMMEPITRTMPPATIAARLRVLRRLRVRDYSFDFPVRYLRATRDRVVPRRASDECARRVPGTDVIDIPGSHLLAQHSPQAVANQIARLIVDDPGQT